MDTWALTFQEYAVVLHIQCTRRPCQSMDDNTLTVIRAGKTHHCQLRVSTNYNTWLDRAPHGDKNKLQSNPCCFEAMSIMTRAGQPKGPPGGHVSIFTQLATSSAGLTANARSIHSITPVNTAKHYRQLPHFQTHSYNVHVHVHVHIYKVLTQHATDKPWNWHTSC